MVRLNRDRRSPGKGHRLDHIGIKRALGEKFCIPHFARFFFEYINKQASNDLALFFRIADPV